MKVICIDGKEARIFVTVCDPLIDRLLGRDLYLLVSLLSRIKLFLWYSWHPSPLHPVFLGIDHSIILKPLLVFNFFSRLSLRRHSLIPKLASSMRVHLSSVTWSFMYEL